MPGEGIKSNMCKNRLSKCFSEWANILGKGKEISKTVEKISYFLQAVTIKILEKIQGDLL